MNVNGGMNIQSFFYAFWEPFVCIGICLMLMISFKNKVDQINPLFKWLSENPSRFILFIRLLL
jgi:glucans biosynthesis protein C